MAKRIMRSFQLDEISAVNSPAQKGARVAIMKRDGNSGGADTMTTVDQIAKRRLIKACAINNPIEASEAFCKEELYACVEDMARELMKAEPQRFAKINLDKMAVARAHIGQTPDGAALLKACYMAKSDPDHFAKANSRPKPTATPADEATSQIDTIARDIMLRENVPHSRARALAWARNPEIKANYDNHRKQQRMATA